MSAATLNRIARRTFPAEFEDEAIKPVIEQTLTHADDSGVADFIRGWRGRDAKIPHAFILLKFNLGVRQTLASEGVLGQKCLKPPASK